MDIYESKKGISYVSIITFVLLSNVAIIILKNFINLYVIISLLKILLIAIDIYGLYYFLLSMSLKYTIDEGNLHIVSILGLKKVTISLKNIEGYKVKKGKINGVQLRGVGNGHFAYGRYVIDKIGTTRMFITSNANVIYLKVGDISYGLSPEDLDKFTESLNNNGICSLDWQYIKKKPISLYREKRFMVPFIIVSIIIILFTMIPFILHLKGLLPQEMPLSFDAKFNPVVMGTARQFVVKQMIYGVLNMAILVCMYYAAYFHTKYDKKSATTYIYISLLISLVFFIMQIKTLTNFIV